MNKKLIAAAVSAAVVAPVASYADVTVYGRINNALKFTDPDGGDSSTSIANVSSRVGVKASAELGNGLTARARYEFSTFTDKEGVLDEGGSGNGGINDTRIGTVGIAGNFGTIDVGNQWSGYYNMVGTYLDPTYSEGFYLYSSAIGGPYRQSNAIAWANSFGPVSIQLDIRIQDPDETNTEKIGGSDGAGLAGSWSVTDNIVLAAAYDSQDGGTTGTDTDRTGIAASFGFGGFSIFGGWQQTDYDGTADSAAYIWGTAGLGEKTTLQLGYGKGDKETDNTKPDQFTLGVYHNMGGGLRLYYEGTAFSADTVDGDLSEHLLGMRFDF